VRDWAVPELSRFFGIVIGMFYDEHGPPHFHARYRDYKISMEIGSGSVVGRFPPRALLLVQDWARLHEAELLANWRRARAGEPLEPITPME
jgi:hypothetical protein